MTRAIYVWSINEISVWYSVLGLSTSEINTSPAIFEMKHSIRNNTPQKSLFQLKNIKAPILLIGP